MGTSVSCAKAVELNEMLPDGQACMRQHNLVLDMAPDPPWQGTFEGACDSPF